VCFLTGLDRVLRGRRARAYTMGWLASDVPTNVAALSGAFMLCRRDAVERAGGFDERFFMYAEDIDLCVRLARAGGRVRYWPGVDVMHAGGGSGRNAASRRAFFRTMAPLMRRHRPGRATPLVAVAVAVAAEAGLVADRVARAARRRLRERQERPGRDDPPQ
jgi:GT2 family glycosyltransferase